MIQKVYVGKVLGNILYDLKKEFPGAKLLFVDQMSVQEFRAGHRQNLFTRKDTQNAFIGVDEFKQEETLPLIDAINIPVIWTFNSLAKNTKLFKKLDAITSVDFDSDIEKSGEVKKFATSYAKSIKLNIEVYPRLLNSLPADKSAISRELDRIKLGEEVLSPEQLNENLGLASLNDDAFGFIDKLFAPDLEGAYLYAAKLSKTTNPIGLSVLLIKKIDSMIFLGGNKEDEAMKYWRHFGPMLWDAKKLAKKLGQDKLFELRKVCKDLGNIFDESPTTLKLTRLINSCLEISAT